MIGARRSVKATCTSICLTSLLQVRRMVTHEIHSQPVFDEEIFIAKFIKTFSPELFPTSITLHNRVKAQGVLSIRGVAKV